MKLKQMCRIIIEIDNYKFYPYLMCYSLFLNLKFFGIVPLILYVCAYVKAFNFELGKLANMVSRGICTYYLDIQDVCIFYMCILLLHVCYKCDELCLKISYILYTNMIGTDTKYCA